jgi:hypothetical protein
MKSRATAIFIKYSLALFSTLLLAGCVMSAPEQDVQAELPEQESSIPAPEENQTQEPEPEPEPETETETETETEREIETTPCSQTVQAGIESTIKTQTASFAVEDFELAYSYSSDSFQASVTLQRFIEIIQGSYGPLISSSTLSFENCIYFPESLASIDVRFTDSGAELYALRYVMVESDQGWRVDGAGALAVVGSGV